MVAQPAVRMWSLTSANVSSPDQIVKTADIIEGYTVITDPGDSVVDALRADGLPEIGDAYRDPDVLLLCTGRNPQQVSPIFWVIRIIYSGQFGGDGGVTPIAIPPRVEWSNITSTEPIDDSTKVVLDGEDVPGQTAIATVLGEPLDGVTKPVSDIRLVVTRNYLDINMPATIDYLDSVNNDAWPPGQAFAPGQAHMESFNAKEMINPALPQGYYEVTAEIHFRVPYKTTAERAWYARVRHEGYRRLVDKDDPNNKRIVNAIDDNQADITRPLLLNKDGEVETNPDNAIWIEFERFQYKLPYAALGLLDP